MCQERALVERPSCSSTRNHSILVQPWPPCSGAWRPPESPASIASRLMRCFSSSGILPPLFSASSSLGIRTSSTKRRARSWRSRCSGVRSAAVAAGAAGVTVIGVLRVVEISAGRGSAGHGCRARRAPAPGPRPGRRRPPLRAPASGPRPGTRARRAVRPWVTSRSARTRSVSTSAGGGSPPVRSMASASGNSLSGSGVSESHASRAPNGGTGHGIMRLITKSGA